MEDKLDRIIQLLEASVKIQSMTAVSNAPDNDDVFTATFVIMKEAGLMEVPE